MQKKYAGYLIDPLTEQSLTLTVYEEKDERVIAGLLTSATNWYPIIHGIPRLLIGDLKDALLRRQADFFRQFNQQFPEHVRQQWQQIIDQASDTNQWLEHQTKTADSFAYEWKHIYQENDYERHNFLHFLSPFITAHDIKDKLTLDIGCGSGRFTKWAALMGARVAFATDLGDSVEVAYELTKHLPNVCVIQADIYAMPFRHIIDLAYCIGVLHHLPKPQDGFAKLSAVVKPSGRLLIWVYSRRHNARAIYLYEPLRAVARYIPRRLLYTLCYVPAVIVHSINQLTLLCRELGADTLSRKIPFFYYANFPFNMKLNDSFDVLATPKSNYYYIEDIKSWFEQSGLHDIQAYEHAEAGITCIGRKA